LQLREKTRFFAAASVTNQMLAAVARMTFPKRLSRNAVEILDDLGQSLQKANQRLAERVNAERRWDILLDGRIVEIEQSLVERYIEQTARTAPGTARRVIAELDALLTWVTPSPLFDSLFPSVCGYLSVLRSVRRQVGSPIRFALQAHRVRIGQQLIARIRTGSIHLC
jgi:hypothetical protein